MTSDAFITHLRSPVDGTSAPFPCLDFICEQNRKHYKIKHNTKTNVKHEESSCVCVFSFPSRSSCVVVQAHNHFLLPSLSTPPIDALTCHLCQCWQWFYDEQWSCACSWPNTCAISVAHAQSLRLFWWYQYYFSICCRGTASTAFPCVTVEKNPSREKWGIIIFLVLCTCNIIRLRYYFSWLLLVAINASLIEHDDDSAMSKNVWMKPLE